MVLSKLIEENGPNFLSDLLRGDMLEIVYRKSGSEITVKWLSAAAEAISTRFISPHQYGRHQTLNVSDCLGKSQAKFEAEMFGSKVSELMDHFGKWLYTGKIDIEGWNAWDLWKLGEAFGAPRYQNDIMKAVCGEGLDSDPSFLVTEYFSFDSGTLKKCWEQTDFTADAAHKCYLEQGLEDSEVRNLIHDGGYVAEHIVQLLVEAARGKTSSVAPWKFRNVQKYLVNEVIILEDSSSEEETEDHLDEDVEDGNEDDQDEDNDENEDEEEMNDEFKTNEESTFTAEELLAEGHRLAQPRHAKVFRQITK